MPGPCRNLQHLWLHSLDGLPSRQLDVHGHHKRADPTVGLRGSHLELTTVLMPPPTGVMSAAKVLGRRPSILFIMDCRLVSLLSCSGWMYGRVTPGDVCTPDTSLGENRRSVLAAAALLSSCRRVLAAAPLCGAPCAPSRGRCGRRHSKPRLRLGLRLFLNTCPLRYY